MLGSRSHSPSSARGSGWRTMRGRGSHAGGAGTGGLGDGLAPPGGAVGRNPAINQDLRTARPTRPQPARAVWGTTPNSGVGHGGSCATAGQAPLGLSGPFPAPATEKQGSSGQAATQTLRAYEEGAGGGSSTFTRVKEKLCCSRCFSAGGAGRPLESITPISIGTQTEVCSSPGEGFAGACGAAWDWPECASRPVHRPKLVVSPGLEEVVLI